MDKSKRVLNLSHTDIETFEEKDFKGYAAIDVTEYCFGELEDDPWDTLRSLRALLRDARLRLTFGGQSLLGYRHYPDEIVDAFVAAAVDNGINVIRIFDALNDARNLETAAAAAKNTAQNSRSVWSMPKAPSILSRILPATLRRSPQWARMR